MSQPELTPEIIADQVRRQQKAERDEDLRDEIAQAERLAESLESDVERTDES